MTASSCVVFDVCVSVCGKVESGKSQVGSKNEAPLLHSNTTAELAEFRRDDGTSLTGTYLACCLALLV